MSRSVTVWHMADVLYRVSEGPGPPSSTASDPPWPQLAQRCWAIIDKCNAVPGYVYAAA